MKENSIKETTKKIVYKLIIIACMLSLVTGGLSYVLSNEEEEKEGSETIIVGVLNISELMDFTNCENVDELGKCINDNGMTLYYSSGCPACINQKQILGNITEEINTVDCVMNSDKCTNIEYVPTWIKD